MLLEKIDVNVIIIDNAVRLIVANATFIQSSSFQCTYSIGYSLKCNILF